jgi:hypothetical protein
MNIWKKWRGKEKDQEPQRSRETQDQEWLAMIEETLEKLEKKEKTRREIQKINEEKRRALLADRKTKQK